MPASRHVLRDIHDKELNPEIPYRECGKDGRLTGDEDFRHVLRDLEIVAIAFEQPTHPKHEKPTGTVVSATAEVEIVDDGFVLAASVITEKNVDATPVSDPSPGILEAAGGEEIVLASSKKIKAQKAKDTASVPASKPAKVEKPAE